MPDKLKKNTSAKKEPPRLQACMYPLIVDIAVMAALPDSGYHAKLLETIISRLNIEGAVSERMMKQYTIIQEDGSYHLASWRLAAADFDAMIANPAAIAVPHEQIRRCMELLTPYTANGLVKSRYDQMDALQKYGAQRQTNEANRASKKTWLVVLALVIALALPLVYNHLISPAIAYHSAMSAIVDHDFYRAIDTLQSIPGYRDAPQKIEEAYYLWGGDLVAARDFESAVIAYTRSNGYADSDAQLLNCHYLWAEHAMGSGDYQKAIEEYALSSEAYDVTEKTAEAWFRLSDERLQAGEYAQAAAAYRNAEGIHPLSDTQQEAYYLGGQALLPQGNSQEAYQVFSLIRDYKDAADIINGNAQLKLHDRQNRFAPGSIIHFGAFGAVSETTGEVPPLEWIVVEQSGSEAVLVSRYIVTSRRIETSKAESIYYYGHDTSWDTSALRTWLNNDFTTAAFSAEERAALALTQVSPHRGGGNTLGIIGSATQDHVYLLSSKELKAYLPILTTSEAYRRDSSRASEWWLRSIAPISKNSRENTYCFVDTKGYIDTRGQANESRGIRPVIRVNILHDVYQFD